MNRPTDQRTLGEDLAAWGRVIVLETRGRVSGEARRASVGFVEEPDGALLVAANSAATHWARNLVADPACVVEREGAREDRIAVALSGDPRGSAVRALILKYGTPAERLGGGPAFRLERPPGRRSGYPG